MTAKVNRTAKPSILESLQVRWELAIAEATTAGVQVSENVFSCCGSCVNLIDLGIDGEKPYAWTPGYQGQAYEWKDPNTVIHYEEDVVEDEEGNQLWDEDEVRTYYEPVDHIYFHHDKGGAEIVVKAFSAHGFKTEWDGNEFKAVKVVLK